MAESLKRLKARIHSVESVGKLTKAMRTISLSKLRPLQKRLVLHERCFERIEKALADLAAGLGPLRHPFFERRPGADKLLLLVVASDTGLCGGYNNALFHAADGFIRQRQAKGVELVIVGKKAIGHFRRSGLPITDSFTELYGRYSAEKIAGITRSLADPFLSGRFGEVHAAYTKCETASRNKAVVEKLLAIELGGGARRDYLLEPDMNTLVGDLAPLYLSSRVGSIILNAFTAEQSMRVMAMSEATENAEDLLDTLILSRNKIRQAEITTEISEVVSAADALKG